jgi:hypothetical protein
MKKLIEKLKYFVILPLILAGCGVSLRIYNKVATDTKVTTEKLSIIAPFVAANFPVKEKIIQGKSDTTIIHDTTIETAIIYDTITKLYDSIKIKNIVSNRLILRTDTIRLKSASDCYEINNRLLSSELKVKDLQRYKNKLKYLIISISLGIIFTVLIIFIINKIYPL